MRLHFFHFFLRFIFGLNLISSKILFAKASLCRASVKNQVNPEFGPFQILLNPDVLFGKARNENHFRTNFDATNKMKSFKLRLLSELLESLKES